MEFEWDEKKALANLRKHGIDFADAATAFGDERALTLAEDDPDEERYATVGMDALGRLLVVIYAMQGKRISIISARGPLETSGRSTIKAYETRIRF